MYIRPTTDYVLTGLYFSLLIATIVVPIAKVIIETIKNNWPP